MLTNTAQRTVIITAKAGLWKTCLLEFGAGTAFGNFRPRANETQHRVKPHDRELFR
jgi:hypothetical protein